MITRTNDYTHHTYSHTHARTHARTHAAHTHTYCEHYFSAVAKDSSSIYVFRLRLRLALPEADSGVTRAGGVEVALWGVPHAVHGTVVPLVHVCLDARLRIEDVDPHIGASRNELLN